MGLSWDGSHFWTSIQNDLADSLFLSNQKRSPTHESPFRFPATKPLLFYAGVAHRLGAIILLGFMIVDDTQILGINRWIKPFKFFVSVAIYLLTFCWLSGDLPKSRFIRIFSGQIVLAMVVENTAIVYQAARGVKSHFNMETPEGGLIFALMGLFILYNTVWVILFHHALFQYPFGYPTPTLRTWGTFGSAPFSVS